jgi:hypothetical protein
MTRQRQAPDGDMTLPSAGETGLKERTWRGEAAFHSRIACS